jgi:hypothetical protein
MTADEPALATQAEGDESHIANRDPLEPQQLRQID